ncbi:hypothetical protein EDD22DRAFT_850725 [Suillus occidentalis]|nr:hypothetical protein EDD22DRAFT_850725 [Suillus occidentalis]
MVDDGLQLLGDGILDVASERRDGDAGGTIEDSTGTENHLGKSQKLTHMQLTIQPDLQSRYGYVSMITVRVSKSHTNKDLIAQLKPLTKNFKAKFVLGIWGYRKPHSFNLYFRRFWHAEFNVKHLSATNSRGIEGTIQQPNRKHIRRILLHLVVSACCIKLSASAALKSAYEVHNISNDHRLQDQASSCELLDKLVDSSD